MAQVTLDLVPKSRNKC